MDAYCERYHLPPYQLEAALLDPVVADSFWRTLEMWSLEAQHYKPQRS